ncbi:hypothetical protein QN277_017703 [Acacia crassicarpa]|uniref:Chorismate mutase n=1 Tax=Acacia crassicarpa TaxID=499986 RepID=A0AAE1MQS7_9FABA|nr:hypothetical protein QN277_017703 [Acacia crassicarpa]
MAADSNSEYTLDSVRKALERQEDTIIFNLIDRAKFPLNSHTYEQHYATIASILNFLFRNTEAIQAKAGRYKSPEENPFFPEYLPKSVVPDYPFSKILHPGAASVNINKSIWALYFQQLLPLLVASGDDGNYAQTAAADLSLLQAISRRIHYGKFVAEAKFRESPKDYEPLICAQDKEGLMKLLTSERVEEMVKKRVEKKAMVFGQSVSLERDDDDKTNYKVNPSLVYRLYDKWVIPLTKEVEVQYLLRRLD